jgi:DNA mismatch repair protein MSH4
VIEARSDAVAELLSHDMRYEQLDGLARRFIDLARTLRHFSHSPKQKARTAVANEKHIRAIIALKHQVLLFAPLAQLLATCRAPALQGVCAALASGAFRALLADVDTVLARDTALSRNAQKMRTEIVFAIQSGVNGLLDVARKSYTETVEDMSALLLAYQARYQMPTLQLQFAVGKGFHLTGPLGAALPADFVQVQRQARRFRCSTEQLLSLNQRNNESLQEILIITERLLGDLVARVGARLAPLLAASDALTQLDMLMAFAALAKKTRAPYTQAKVTPSPSAPLAIKAGRHPILEQLASVREHGGFTANDLIVGACEHNLLVIGGQNMAGKSTLLRQTALVVVLAHVGCFVPAELCSMRTIERLCVRIGDDGATKSDASSFFVECRQAAAALECTTPHALLLIDELGRSTANDVGVALSWSVAEHILLRTRSLALFVTHYSELHRLEQLYPSAVRSMHMSVYQLASGPNQRESYGIDVAAQADMPQPLIDDARRIRAQLDQKALENKARNQQLAAARSAAERAQDELAKRLLQIRHSSLAPAPLREYLVALANDFDGASAATH